MTTTKKVLLPLVQTASYCVPGISEVLEHQAGVLDNASSSTEVYMTNDRNEESTSVLEAAEQEPEKSTQNGKLFQCNVM